MNSETSIGKVLKASYPWAVEWERELKELFAGYVEAK